MIEKIKKFIFGDVPDSLERSLFNEMCKKLSENNEGIVRSQMNLYNSVYRDYDEEKEVLTAHFYKNSWGKSTSNYPLKFTVEEEFCLCEMKLDIGNNNRLNVSFICVKGIVFMLKIKSNSDVFSPITPSFKLLEISVHEPQ